MRKKRRDDYFYAYFIDDSDIYTFLAWISNQNIIIYMQNDKVCELNMK